METDTETYSNPPRRHNIFTCRKCGKAAYRNGEFETIKLGDIFTHITQFPEVSSENNPLCTSCLGDEGEKPQKNGNDSENSSSPRPLSNHKKSINNNNNNSSPEPNPFVEPTLNQMSNGVTNISYSNNPSHIYMTSSGEILYPQEVQPIHLSSAMNAVTVHDSPYVNLITNQPPPPDNHHQQQQLIHDNDSHHHLTILSNVAANELKFPVASSPVGGPSELAHHQHQPPSGLILGGNINNGNHLHNNNNTGGYGQQPPSYVISGVPGPEVHAQLPPTRGIELGSQVNNGSNGTSSISQSNIQPPKVSPMTSSKVTEGDKPRIECPLCKKTFKNSKVASLHRKRIHEKDQQHKCETCSAVFTTR